MNHREFERERRIADAISSAEKVFTGGEWLWNPRIRPEKVVRSPRSLRTPRHRVAKALKRGYGRLS